MLSFSGCGMLDEFSSWKGQGKPSPLQPVLPRGLRAPRGPARSGPVLPQLLTCQPHPPSLRTMLL